jgi:cytochrome c oxidase subunit II
MAPGTSVRQAFTEWTKRRLPLGTIFPQVAVPGPTPHPHLKPATPRRLTKAVRARRRRRLAKAAFLALAVSVTTVAAVLLSGVTKDNTPADPGAQVMRIDMSGFSPNSIPAKVGEPVRVDLINPDNGMHADGGGYHNFVLERFGVNKTVKPQSQLVFDFVPTEAGDFMWYCSICCGGKESPSMQGWLRVVA